MWFNLKTTLTGERYQTLAKRVDRLQELLQKTEGESSADRSQDFKDFAHATGNGLAEVVRADGSRAFPSPSPAAQSFPWPAVQSLNSERFLHVNASGQSYWVLVRKYALDGQPVYLLAAAPGGGKSACARAFLGGPAGLGAGPAADFLRGRLLAQPQGAQAGGQDRRNGPLHQHPESF